MGKDGQMEKIGSNFANAYQGKGMAVFTSGGDSPGMNAAVRASVRFGLYLGCNVYLINEGYQGLVDGGDNFQEAYWETVSGIISSGGTVIGSARCQAFREREGRLKAARNLIEKRITNLVVIGGDGSLTGANRFRQDWSGLLDELVMTKQISEEERTTFSHLNIVGMVGTIDNDFCGSDMTIGTDTALHRIIETTDKIMATAYSHQRTFIIEVMGRHCGYLALVSGIASEADYVFIPECPAEKNWPEDLCMKLTVGREKAGQRANIIIVSEGALDRDGNKITCEMVKKVIVDNLQQDTRITVLGHIQRGGAPSAFDRILGCRLGAEAVFALMDATPETEPCVVTLVGNNAVRVPLMKCVEKTQAVAKAMANKNWEEAVELRGRCFQGDLATYRMLQKDHSSVITGEKNGAHSRPSYNIAVMCVGKAPAPGMNAAVRSVVRNSILNGHNILGVKNGFDGLINDDIDSIEWGDVTGWVSSGGALLGITDTLPNKDIQSIAKNMRKHNIHAVLMVGGFTAFESLLQLYEQRDNYTEFCIPMLVLPAAICNNVPGTDFSIGTDTALNRITTMCDRFKQSAQGARRRVFILETMGGYCGYLTSLAGLAAGADAAYIKEEKFTIRDLMEDLEIVIRKMNHQHIERGMILRNERASEKYDTNFIRALYSEEGKGIFDTKTTVMGYMQRGGNPSPFDRNMSTKLGAKSFNWIIEQLEKPNVFDKVNGNAFTRKKDSACLLGLRVKAYAFQPIDELKSEANFEERRWKHIWWHKCRSISAILSQHNASYSPECVITCLESTNVTK